MTDRVPLDERDDERITDDVVACLRRVNPAWLGLFPDDSTLTLHVRDTLDELELLARESGYASTGCMSVEYDSDSKSMHYLVLIGTKRDVLADESML